MKDAGVFAAIALAVLFAAAWILAVSSERRRRNVQARLATVLVSTPEQRADGGRRVSLRRDPTTGGMGRLPLRLHRRILEELAATGDRLTVTQLTIAAVVGIVFGTGLELFVFGWPPLIALPLIVAGGVVFANLRLRWAQRRFRNRFVDLFPDLLDVIVRAVRAGLPVLDALEAAVGNVGEPVSSEMRRLLDDLRIGVDVETALANTANRIRVNDFRFFAATLVLQRRTGGSLAETLANLAGLIRRRKELRLKASALSAESRMSAYVIGGLPFVTVGLMYLVNPTLVSVLFTDHRGKVILWIAIGLWMIGFAVIQSMVKGTAR